MILYQKPSHGFFDKPEPSVLKSMMRRSRNSLSLLLLEKNKGEGSCNLPDILHQQTAFQGFLSWIIFQY